MSSIPLPLGALSISAGQVVAALSIAALAAANLFGVAAASRVAALVTMLKVVAVVAIPVVAIAAWPHTPALTPIVPPVARPLAAFGVAMIAVMWAYEGWAYLAFAAGEVHDPSRTLPRAFIYGTLGLTVVYVLVNVGYFVALPLAAISGETRVAEKAMTAVVGPLGATVVAAIVCLSTLGCNMSAVLAISRAGYAMAVDGMFFRFAALVHPKYRTPHGALLGLAFWSCALDALGQLRAAVHVRDVRRGRCSTCSQGSRSSGSAGRTRISPRPYRTWGYPVVPLVFVLGSLGLVVNTLLERPAESVAGLLLMAAGLPAYAYWRARRVRPDRAGASVMSHLDTPRRS